MKNFKKSNNNNTKNQTQNIGIDFFPFIGKNSDIKDQKISGNMQSLFSVPKKGIFNYKIPYRKELFYNNKMSAMMQNFSNLGLKSISYRNMLDKYTLPESRFIDINGIKVHYCDQGKGPILLLLHGMLSSLHTWNEWVKILSPHFRIIRIDLPGFGLTKYLSSKPNLDTYMHFLYQLVQKLNLKDFFITGNSIGGYLAWNFSVRYPEKVNKLILIDAVGYPQNLPWIVNFVTKPVFRTIASMMTPRIFIDRNVKTIYGDKNKVTEELIDLYFDMVMSSDNRGSFINLFQTLKSQCSLNSLSKGITEIKVPTLLMWGKNDPWVPVDVLRNWERDLFSSHTIIYDGVGHMPMEEIPLLTAKDAFQFLKKKEL